MKNFTGVATALLLVVACSANAQSDKETARAKAVEAIRLMDGGKVDESIVLLKEAQKLDPKRSLYSYEVGYAYMLKKDYEAVVKELSSSLKYKDVTDQHYQLLGNAYDMMGKTEKAFDAYDKGLKYFPKSGGLYLEKGNVYWLKKEYEKAIPFYEAGIKADPAFPSNYYRMALLYCRSNSKARGMVYGEIFMNLERNSKRTAEMSAVLYETYRSAITIRDTSISVKFGNNVINISKPSDFENLKFPFSLCYETSLSMSLVGVKELNQATLASMRERFVTSYYTMKNNEKCPHILFDYQRSIGNAGHMEAYNRWILMKGDEDEFTRWSEANSEKWDQFVAWFNENQLALNESSQVYVE